MKQINIIIFTLVIILNCYSQENASLIGEWKVVSVDSENFYISTPNDSISVKEKFQNNFKDSGAMENYINSLRLAYINNRFFFDDNGNFSQTSDLATFKSKYKIDRKRNVMEVKDTGIDGKKIKFKTPFRIIGDTLHINLVQTSTKFVLVKVR